MYATDFEYAGEKLSDYGMIICDFNSGGELETVSSGSDITFNQIALNKSNRFFIGSSIYETALTTTIQICRNPCMANSQKEMTISTTEISALQRWLCRRNQYYKFKIDQEDYENIYWNATFSAKQIELSGRIIGMELTLYTDSPFTYMDEVVIETECEANEIFDIYDISDEEGYIYPDMKITVLEDVNVFILENAIDKGRPLKINNCKTNEVITIQGDSHILVSSEHKNLANDFNYCFPRIANTYRNNKNTFTCNTKCKITFSYSPIRKVGL